MLEKKEAPSTPVLKKDELGFEVTTMPEATPWLKMLIFGATGVGKTHLCGTLGDLDLPGPVLYLARRAGLATIRDRDFEVHMVKGTLVIEQITQALKENPTRWSVVVLDSLSVYYDMLLRAIMKADSRPGKDALVPEQRDYQKARTVTHMQLGQMCGEEGWPCHVIVTCLENTVQDRLLGSISTLPMLAGKLQHEVGSHFDIIMYLAVRTEGEEHQRIGLVQPGRRVQAKDRFSALGNQVVDPAFPKIWEAIFGKADNKGKEVT